MPGIVYVVDDDASYRTTTQRLLEAAGYPVVVYSSAQQLLDQLPDEDGSGCILLDVRMPGLSGPELQSRLATAGSTRPIVFLSAYPDISIAVKAIKAGADNFLTKPVKPAELLRAVEKAIARHRRERASRAALDTLRTRLSALTPREREVFMLIVRGKLNKQVAHELGATERTIKAHRRRVMEKMKAESLAELVLISRRLGAFARDDD